MSILSLENISNWILKNVNLEINKGEIFALVGPSGAGKTTLLQVIAGLAPYKGRVCSGDKSLDGIPPYERHVGYLFQDLLLFPHLSVEGNLYIAMNRGPISRREKKERAARLLDTVGIRSLAKRYPHELSGGEKQRAALARALASTPDILLLDEPFSSLDFRIARYLRLEFRRLQRLLGFNALFVTHNLREAQEIADRIGVLKEGVLTQIVEPEEMWLNTESSEESFLEQNNILCVSGQRNSGKGIVEVEWAGFRFFVPDEGKAIERVAIRPRDIFISTIDPPGSPVNRFQGIVKDIRETGGMAIIRVGIGNEEILVEITMEYFKTLGLSTGDNVCGILKLRDLHGC